MRLDSHDLVRVGLACQVADKIRDAILSGRVKIDERLPTEEELARRFQVSRPTIREALKRLAAQNLIRSRRGPAGGTFVERPDPRGLASAISGAATLLVGMGAFDIDEMIVARFETEAVCCRLACERRGEDHLAAMSAEIRIQRDPATSDEIFCASDVRFHRALVEAAGNGPLSLMMYVTIEAFVPIANMIVSRTRERAAVADLHEEILAAVTARNSGRAVTALSSLLAYQRENYAKSVALRDARGDQPASQAGRRPRHREPK